MRSLSILLSFLFFFVLMASPMALAQQLPAAVPNTAPATTVAPSAAPVDEAIARAEQATQQIRAEERLLDLQNHGLKWVPWVQTGQATKDFIFNRDEKVKTLIGIGNGIDVAVQDLNLNGKPDMILYYWKECGNQGCMYQIFFDNENQAPLSYFGWELIPYKEGIMLDHGYISF